MATKIRGITIEIGGDASGLDKALKDVKSNAADTQAQLKDVNRLLKLDPKNTELLAQKQKLLAKQVENTEEKLKVLRKAEQELKNSGVDENSAQFMALRREIIDTETSLKSLEKETNDTTGALEKIADVSGKVGDGAGKIANATQKMSAAAGAGLVAIAGLGYKSVVAADDLNTLSKQSGIATADLQKMQYAADLIDVDTDTIISSLRKLKNNMDSTSKETQAAWDAIGVSTRDANGELRDSTVVFYETLDALSKIGNETERDATAMTLFGRSADDLAGIIDDGGAALREYGDQAEQLGYVLDQDTLDSLNAVNDKIDQLKMSLSGNLAKSGASAVEAIAPVVEDIANALTRVLDAIGNMDEGQIKAVIGVLSALALVAPVAKGISMVSTAVSALSGGFALFTGAATSGTAAAKGVAAALGLITNPVFLVIAAIVAVVAAIALFGDEIQAVLQRVDDFLQGVFLTDWTQVFGPGLGDALNGFFATLKTIWDGVRNILNGIIDFIRGVFTGDWKRAWNGVKEIFSGVFRALVGVAKAPINGIIALLNGAIGGLNKMIQGLNKIKFNVPSWVPGLGGKSFGVNIGTIGKIPYLANGGVLSQGSAIVGESGPELLTMSGNRAIVQPLTQNTTTNHNLGGVSVTVYGAPGQDVRELAEIIMDEIQSATERRGAVFA